MKKIIAIMLAAAVACSALSGCTAEELVEFAGPLIATTPAETDPVVEPVATEAPVVEDVPETMAPTEPAPDEGWQPGDEVWWVHWDPETGGWPYPGVVLGVCDEYLIISWGWDAEGEQVFAPLWACYRTYEEAWDSTGKTVVAGEGCG